MNYYLDITLLPGAEIGVNFLMEKVYKQIHIGLTDTQMPNGSSAIGISFPEYNAEKYQLGTKVRLFAQDKQIIENFNAKKWLSRLSDYVHITSVRDVPTNLTNYVRFKRKQSKSNTERLARRKAKREGIEYDKAFKLLQSRKEILIKSPFIKMASCSSEQSFRLYIIKEHACEQINEGFSCYGLSAISTLPDF